MESGEHLPFVKEVSGNLPPEGEAGWRMGRAAVAMNGELITRSGEMAAPSKKVLLFWQNKDERTLLLRQMVRSGQRISWDGNVVVLGDVNPGAELVARGDILVLGTFRGMAHAGAMGNRKAVIAAYRLLPTQLRIAEYISRPPDGDFLYPVCPEMATVRGGMVVIEKLGSKDWLNLVAEGPNRMGVSKKAEFARRSEDWAR